MSKVDAREYRRVAAVIQRPPKISHRQTNTYVRTAIPNSVHRACSGADREEGHTQVPTRILWVGEKAVITPPAPRSQPHTSAQLHKSNAENHSKLLIGNGYHDYVRNP